MKELRPIWYLKNGEYLDGFLVNPTEEDNKGFLVSGKSGKIEYNKYVILKEINGSDRSLFHPSITENMPDISLFKEVGGYKFPYLLKSHYYWMVSKVDNTIKLSTLRDYSDHYSRTRLRMIMFCNNDGVTLEDCYMPKDGSYYYKQYEGLRFYPVYNKGRKVIDYFN